jgi:hypothetical protein
MPVIIQDILTLGTDSSKTQPHLILVPLYQTTISSALLRHKVSSLDKQSPINKMSLADRQTTKTVGVKLSLVQ